MLISPNGDPLLSDFGVSRMLIASGTLDHTTTLGGTARWMAVELLKPTEEGDAPALPTTESDVWAFGMTVYVSTSFHRRFVKIVLPDFAYRNC